MTNGRKILEREGMDGRGGQWKDVYTYNTLILKMEKKKRISELV